MKNANLFTAALSGLFLCLIIPSAVAVELTDVTGPTIGVTEFTDLPDTDLSDGICRTSENGCSLRAAIQESNQDTDRVRLIQLFAGTIINDLKQDYDITSSVVIQGSLDLDGNIASAVAGTNFSRIFDIKRNNVQTTEVLIRDLRMQDGPAIYSGGIPEKNGSMIFSRGDLTLDNVTIVRGGLESNAIFNEGGALEFINSRKLGNGRAIATEFGTVRIDNSRFEQGEIKTGGAAIQNQGGTVTISNSAFVSNRADTQSPGNGRGGAIQHLAGTMIIESSQFSTNRGVLGGAIYSAATLIIKNGVTFGGNLASRAGPQSPNETGISDGGALYLAAGQAFVRDAGFSGNDAERNGGAIYVASAANAQMLRVSLRFNESSLSGGGIFFEPSTTGSSIRQSLIQQNTVDDTDVGSGGGLVLSGGVTVRELLISNNAAFSGAGVAATGDGNAIENSTIVLNNTGFITQQDGAVFGTDAGVLFDSTDAAHELTLTHVTVAGNTSAPDSTAGITAKTGKIVLKNSIVIQPAANTTLCAGTIVSTGNNVSGDATCNLTLGSDKPNETGEFVLDLDDNGGILQTTALPPTSVAINLVPGAECLATDQRLFGRDTANRCDAGAYETGGLQPANSGQLNFLAQSFPRSESDGVITLTVERSGGSAGAVSVEVVDLLAGDASLGADYNYSQQTLSWADGDSTAKSFTVEIIDDGNKESNASEEVIFALLSNTGSARIGDRDIARLSILDNDTVAFGEYKLAKSTYTIQEELRDDSPNTGEGGERIPKPGFASIEIQRVGPADQAATMKYQTIDGTAKEGEDYIGVGSLITFAPNESSKFVTVTLINDKEFEADETFFFEISSDPSVQEVFFANPTRATITIDSDDAEPVVIEPPVLDRKRGATGSINPWVLILFWGLALLSNRFRLTRISK